MSISEPIDSSLPYQEDTDSQGTQVQVTSDGDLVQLQMTTGGVPTTILRGAGLGLDGMMIIEGLIGAQSISVDGDPYQLAGSTLSPVSADALRLALEADGETYALVLEGTPLWHVYTQVR